MNEEYLIKKQLIEKCKMILENELHHTKRAINEAQVEANSHKRALESRQSTFKDEAQYKVGACARKLLQLDQQLTQLNFFKVEIHEKVKFGSVDITQDKIYFLLGYLSTETI